MSIDFTKSDLHLVKVCKQQGLHGWWTQKKKVVKNSSYQRISGVVVNVQDCDIVVSEFELNSHYYVHFRTNTLGKGMNPFVLSYGLNSSTGRICPIGWSCRIHRLHLCSGVRSPPQCVIPVSWYDTKQSHGFGEYGALLHCHCSQVPSDPAW